MFEDTPRDQSLADPLPADPFSILLRWFEEAQSSGLGKSRRDDRRNARRTRRSARADRAVPRRRYATRRVAVLHESRQRQGPPDCRTCACQRRVVLGSAGPSGVRSRRGRTRPAMPSRMRTGRRDRDYRSSRPGAVVRASRSQRARRCSNRSMPRPNGSAASKVRSRVPRPAHWGGYRVVLDRLELWVASSGRAHDRVLWQREREGAAWRAARLQP